jgi:broad specificity phosphatase PhoE
MTHTITLLRHGLSTANETGVVQGQLDYPLSEVGVAQAAALAEYWHIRGEEFDAILSSPLLRARQTAEIIGAKLSVPVEFDPVWMERHMGNGQGLAGSEFERLRDARPLTSPYEPPFGSGESDWDLHRRAGDALQNLIRRPPGNYLVVSHGALLNALLRALLGMAPYGRTKLPGFAFDNSAYARLLYDDISGGWQIHALNATRHLDARRDPP